MLFRDIPIRKKLMRIMFLINGVVLVVTCVSFFMYEFYIFRKTSTEKLATIGKIIAANSTASLAFDNADDAKEILAALKTEPHIIAAALYDTTGRLFSSYSPGLSKNILPPGPGAEGYRFIHSHLEGFEPVIQESKQLGFLYLESDLGDMYDRFRLFGFIAGVVILVSSLLAWLLSKIFQESISKPILDLAGTAQIISGQKDYSVRASVLGADEVGSLTNAFNQMLDQIQEQTRQLSGFNQGLERKVMERTAQLESVNKELEAFSYSVSHDLRAPLRAVIGFTSILEEDYVRDLDAEAKRITSVIKSNTMKMGQLIDDLLAFSRVGRYDIIKTTIDTREMVKEIVGGFAALTEHAKISWVIGLLPPVKADMNTIRQVWVNLVSNAVKYSGKKEIPRIEIGSFAENGQVVFFVRDNGVGFDQQYSKKLFKVFQRLHSADEFEGTGVGLALVEKIVSKHMGRVWAESEVDKGACFYFSLPAVATNKKNTPHE